MMNYFEEQKAVANYTAEELNSGLATAKANLASAQRGEASEEILLAMQRGIEELEKEIATRKSGGDAIEEDEIEEDEIEEEERLTMDKKTVEFLNGLPDLEEVLSTPLNCEMPYFDHTGGTLEDTGRFPG